MNTLISAAAPATATATAAASASPSKPESSRTAVQADRQQMEQAQRQVAALRSALDSAQLHLSTAQHAQTGPQSPAPASSALADRYAAQNALAQSAQTRRQVINLVA
jgi:hypothetical protein